MFSQSGVFASSKSASQTFAPELSALMVIFRSVGPVISTRRSTRPGAGAGTRQSESSLMCRVPGRKSSVPPADRSTWRAARAASNSGPLAAELTLEHGDQAQRIGSQDLPEPVPGRAQDLNAIVSRHLALLLLRWNVELTLARGRDGGQSQRPPKPTDW